MNCLIYTFYSNLAYCTKNHNFCFLLYYCDGIQTIRHMLNQKRRKHHKNTFDFAAKRFCSTLCSIDVIYVRNGKCKFSNVKRIMIYNKRLKAMPFKRRNWEEKKNNILEEICTCNDESFLTIGDFIQLIACVVCRRCYCCCPKQRYTRQECITTRWKYEELW